MSLAVLADHMASKGRNGDSMLVHMTPDEVRGLHALAEAHGGGLTINPETGLPEANFLKRLLPTIIGAVLTPLTGGLINPMTAGMLVGGFEAIRTGDLGKGIAAGLGAYGGANLSSALAGAGTSAGIEAAVGAGAPKISEGEIAKLMLQTDASRDVVVKQLQKEALEKATTEAATRSFGDRAMAGLQGLTSDAGRARFMEAAGGLPGLVRMGYMGASPALAGDVPTATSMPSGPGAPSMMRPYRFDYRTRTWTAQPIYPARDTAATTTAQAPTEEPPLGGAGGGLMSHYATGGGVIDDFAQSMEPVVRMANGGPLLPSDIGTYTPEQKADLYNKFLGQGFTDAAIRQAAGQQTDTDWQTLQRIAAQRGSPAVSGAERTVLTDPNWRSISGQTGLEGLNANIQNFVQQNPNLSYSQVQAAANQYGVDAADIRRAVEAGGGSGGLQNVLTQADWRSRTGLTGLEGMNNNIQMWFAENPNATEAQIRQAMQGVNINDADIMRAMGKSVKDLAYKAPEKPPVTAVSPTFTPTDTGTTITPAPLPGLPDFAPTTPTLIPATQFTPQTMEEVRTKYEQGGGATRMPTITDIKPGERTYTQNAVADLITGFLQTNPNAQYGEVLTFARMRGIPEYQARAAFNEFRFSGLTGDSKAAYNYLMGRGAYPTGSLARPVIRPYAEAMGLTDSAMRRYVPSTPERREALSAGTGTTGATNQAALDRLRSTFDRSIFNQTPDAKAAYYNSLLAAGYDDATIRAAIDAPLDENWLALQAIAARLRAGTTGGGGVSSTRVTSGGASMGGSSSGAGSSGTSTTGSGTPITDFLFGTQDASKVPVEDRTITRLQDRQPEVSEYDPNAYNYDVGSGYYGASDTEDRDEDEDDTEAKRNGGLSALAGGGMSRMRLMGVEGGAARGGHLGDYSDGGRLLRGPGDGVSDSIPATIAGKRPARLADGEFVVPARIVSELGNGSTEAGARKLYAMMDRIQAARRKSVGKGKVAKNTRADKYLPA